MQFPSLFQVDQINIINIYVKNERKRLWLQLALRGVEHVESPQAPSNSPHRPY